MDDDPVVIAAKAAMDTLCAKPVSYEVAAKVVAAIRPLIEVRAKVETPPDTVVDTLQARGTDGHR